MLDFLLFGFFLGGALFYTSYVHGLYPFAGFENNCFGYPKIKETYLWELMLLRPYLFSCESVHGTLPIS